MANAQYGTMTTPLKERRSAFVLVAILLLAVTTQAQESKRIDPRLATVRHAIVVASDSLGADYPVAVCIAEQLPKLTPIAVVANPSEADVMLRVTAARLAPEVPARLEPRNRATLTATLRDGSAVWSETYFYGSQDSPDVPCALGQNLITTLRDAMKRARE
jgi:hypothetical protein